MNKNDLIKLMLEVLKEDPDTVLGTEEQGELATSDDRGSVAFIIGNFGNGEDCIYYDGRPNEKSSHNHVWAKAMAKYPDKRGWKISLMTLGRIWPDKEICSIYENVQSYTKHSSRIENMFKELKLDINKFRFEYGDSAMDGVLLPWNRLKSGSVKQNTSKEAEKARERLKQILQHFHLADPIKKKELRIEMDKLRQIMGATEGELDASIKIAGDKAAKAEKQYGSVARANYMKGSIAEETVRLYNSGLNPMFWNPDKTLKPEIRKQLLLVAGDFIKESELKMRVFDVRFLGSLAGFNYTQESDIDLHITTDMKQLGIPDDQIVRFGKGISTKWNEDHDVRIHNHKVELFIEDVKSVNRASGIYSLCQNKWLRVPQKLNIQFNKEGIKYLYYELTRKIDNAIATNEVIQMRDVLKRITDMRKVGLDSSGEFSTENIVFKLLRSKGWIEKLKNATNQQLDKDLSLNEGKSGPDMKTLKKNKVKLTDEERELVMSRGAVWHMGNHNGKPSSAIWKSVVNGKTWYVCNTHRAYQCKPTLKGAIKAFEFIETTA